jgi:hypothetical protein
MAKHNTVFLNSFQQMMTGIFGPSADKYFEGESSAAPAGQPIRQDASVQPPPQSMGVQPAFFGLLCAWREVLILRQQLDMPRTRP